jgi:hypothetical protein
MPKKKCEVLVLNNVAQVGLKRFPAEQYAVVKESKDPWAILVRSADLHKHEFGPPSGASRYSTRRVPTRTR